MWPPPDESAAFLPKVSSSFHLRDQVRISIAIGRLIGGLGYNAHQHCPESRRQITSELHRSPSLWFLAAYSHIFPRYTVVGPDASMSGQLSEPPARPAGMTLIPINLGTIDRLLGGRVPLHRSFPDAVDAWPRGVGTFRRLRRRRGRGSASDSPPGLAAARSPHRVDLKRGKALTRIAIPFGVSEGRTRQHSHQCGGAFHGGQKSVVF